MCTLAGVVLGGQAARGQVEAAGGVDVGEADALGEGRAGSEGSHCGWLGGW